MTGHDPEALDQAEESPLYHISFQRLTELNRSAALLMAARSGESGTSAGLLGKQTANPQALVDAVSEYSRNQEGFIQTNMPIQEIVFRILLTRRNEPTTLRELHYEVTERWATPVRPINVSETGLGRILDADTFYGFAKVNTDS